MSCVMLNVALLFSLKQNQTTWTCDDRVSLNSPCFVFVQDRDKEQPDVGASSWRRRASLTLATATLKPLPWP